MYTRRRETIFKSHCFVGLILLSFVAAYFHLTGDNGCAPKARETGHEEQTAVYEEEETERNVVSVPKCNLFRGRWVYDNISYPLYKEGECSFVPPEFGCEMYGRKNVKYQNWRWQPHDCALPRLNGTTLLEKIRGKRVVFVGDSLNKNQWASMLCLIESSLHQSSDKSVIRSGNLFIFNAAEYNATIEFYWSPLLVESNCDNPTNLSITDHIVRFSAIEKHARHWTDADILIFNAFVWWLPQTMTLLWGSFGSSDAIYKKVDQRVRHYELGLNTWSDWLEFNVNQTKTKLFFMSLSPIHTHGESWDEEQHCYNQNEPISKQGYWGVASNREMMRAVESVIQKLETKGIKIEYMNITQLSDYRIDAHPSVYTFHVPSKEEIANPKSHADCGHWCLPGVPDVWNHILYSYIINS